MFYKGKVKGKEDSPYWGQEYTMEDGPKPHM